MVTPANFPPAAGASQELTITAQMLKTQHLMSGHLGISNLVEDSDLAPDSHIPLAVSPSAGIFPQQVKQ